MLRKLTFLKMYRPILEKDNLITELIITIGPLKVDITSFCSQDETFIAFLFTSFLSVKIRKPLKKDIALC